MDLARKTFGSSATTISFGESIEAAQFLGRPDRYGLTLEFEEGRLVECSFDFAAGGEGQAGMLRCEGPDGKALTRATTMSELIARLGRPTSVSEFDDETRLYYPRGGLTSEFQLDEAGRLETGEDCED